MDQRRWGQRGTDRGRGHLHGDSGFGDPAADVRVLDGEPVHPPLLPDPLLHAPVRVRRGRHPDPRPGPVRISSTIYVPSNTTIQLSAGTTLVKSNTTGTQRFSASGSMFMLIRPSLGKVSGAVGGHDGDANITIAGAGGGSSVIDMANLYNTLAIISGHNRGVTISGITFRRMNNNHFIEMDGCADCTIAGNEFLDAAGGTRETAEAINLDTPDPRTGGFSSVWSKQDGTPNERVTIAGNRFDGMQRALGTHNFSTGRYHTDIVVRDNTITSNANDAIHIMNWTNPVFTGNTITSRAGRRGSAPAAPATPRSRPTRSPSPAPRSCSAPAAGRTAPPGPTPSPPTT